LRLTQPGLINRESVAAAQDHRSLDDVLQLTNVARPCIPFAEFQRARLDPANPLGHLFGKSFDEVLDQNRNVLSPFSQRRHVNGKHVQPVKQVRPE
jgi:hypothetical protein